MFTQIWTAPKISLLQGSPRLTSKSESSQFSSLSIPQRRTSKWNSICAGEKPSMSIQASVIDRKLSNRKLYNNRVLHFVRRRQCLPFSNVDNRDWLEPKITPEQAAILCHRLYGVVADGVIFALPGINGADYTMRIFNSDGSEPEMCSNGFICFARFIADIERLHGKQSFTVHTRAGLIALEILEDGKVKFDMGQPILKASDVPTNLTPTKGEAVVKAKLDVDGLIWNVTCVNMGSPHCVTFDSELCKDLQVDELDLAEIGPKFEQHAMFPARTNIEFVQVLSKNHLKMRVWEREGGETLGCVTGAYAAVVAAVLDGRADRRCTVDLPRGALDIEWRENDNHIYVTGTAELVLYGSAAI